jgi:hypothetical protein
MAMAKWMLYVAALAAVVLCSTVYGSDVTPQVGGNNGMLKSRIGFGDPNEGMVGPWGSWSRTDTDHIWGAGVFGRIDLSGQIAGMIDSAFDTPDSWWKLLADLGARAYLVTDVGAVNLNGDADATAVPGFGLVLGPLWAEIGYQVFEGGGIKQAGKLLADDGVVYTIGIQKVFRF